MAKARDQRRKEVSIPEAFTPRFFEDLDGRVAIAKELRKRYEAIKKDAGADSVQKDMLCRRAIFLGIQLETMEAIAAEEGEFDAGVYTQMSNALLGLLKSLGLERKVKKVVDFEAYVRERSA